MDPTPIEESALEILSGPIRALREELGYSGDLVSDADIIHLGGERIREHLTTIERLRGERDDFKAQVVYWRDAHNGMVEERDAARADIAHLTERLAKACKERDEARATIERLRGVLRQVEWCDGHNEDGDPYTVCPWCDGDKPNHEDCALAAAIDESG